MIKILLTSDIHLGVEGEQSPIPEEFRIKTFKKLMYIAKSHDLLLIAGDLFHKTGINEKSINLVNNEFNKLIAQGIKIIYILGDQEAAENTDMSLLQTLKVSKIFLDNDILLPYKYIKDNQTILIYGLSPSSTMNISEIKKIQEPGFHIGLLHTGFSQSDEKNNTRITRFDKKDLITSNLDFFALGHHHQFKLFKSNMKFIGVYTGSPEAVSIDEKGERFVLSVIINNNEIYQIKRLTVNSLTVEHLDFDCSCSNQESIMQTIKENESANKILKIHLTGHKNFKLDIEKLINNDNGYQNIYIEDKSSPGIGLLIEQFADEDSIRGEFFNILKQRIVNNVYPDIDMNIFSDILHKVIMTGTITLEDLCI